MDNARAAPARTPSSGLIFVVLYALSLTLAYLLMRQPAVTGEFPDKVARRFNVLQTIGTGPDTILRSISLLRLREQDPATDPARYRMTTDSVILNESDISRVRVLEQHAHWQLIEFVYANTHTSVSVYKAFDDHVVPVSFQITSHVGLGFAAVALFFAVGLLSVIISGIWRWLARRRAVLTKETKQ